MEINESQLYKEVLNDNPQYLEDNFPHKAFKNYVFSSNFHEGSLILRNSPPLISVIAYLKAFKCLQKMLAYDPDLSLKDKKGLSVQNFAIAGRSTEIVDTLAKKIDFSCYLHYAVSLGFSEMCEHLIENVKVETDKLNDDGQTILHVAAEKGSSEIVSMLLDYGYFDVNAKDNNGNTPIMLAAEKSNLHVIKQLLTCGRVDISSENDKGETLLHLVSQIFNPEIVQLVIGVLGKAKKIEVKQWDFFTLDCLAVENDLDIDDIPVEESKEEPQPFNIDAKTKDGDTPLMYAVKGGCPQTFSYLMSKGASLYEQNYKGETCLHLAVKSKEVEMVKSIISTNAVDVNAKDNNGNTALLVSIKNKTTDITEFLLSNAKNIDINAADSEECTPLHASASNGDANIVKLLLTKEEVQINARNKKIPFIYIYNLIKKLLCLLRQNQVILKLLNCFSQGKKLVLISRMLT